MKAATLPPRPATGGISTTPWALLPAAAEAIQRSLEASARLSADKQAACINTAEAAGRAQRRGAVAVIPVYGIVNQKMNLMTAILGGTSLELLGRQIDNAAADPDVSSIVLRVDSPGGSVYGLTELHAKILQARERKPIVVSVDSFMASGALWLGSAASEIAITPSGEAGSLGVFMLHVDWSGNLKAEGIAVSLIRAGRFKTEGNRFEPLTEEARAAIQEDVNGFYEMFVRDVAKGRGMSVSDVKKNFGEGRMLNATEAKAAGMVDRVETFDYTVSRLAFGGGSAARRTSSESSSLSILKQEWNFLQGSRQ